jgi:hypothetical protein
MQDLAKKLLLKLADQIAVAPRADDVGGDRLLYGVRLDKARRALSKAKAALAQDDFALCTATLNRGLLHLAMAQLHRSDIPAKALGALNEYKFAPGSCEEAIYELIEAICKIKVLIEYKKLKPSRHLRTKLAALVLSLQENIENYAGDTEALHHADILIDCQASLYWSQFLYARLSGELLLPEKTKSSAALKELHQLSFKAGKVSFIGAKQSASATKEQRRTLEKFMEAALKAYSDEDDSDFNKFARLATIEGEALQKYLESHPEQEQSDPIKVTTLKEALLDLENLISTYYPDDEILQNRLSDLKQHYSELKKLVRQGSWSEALEALKRCRSSNLDFQTKISKIIEESKNQE